MKNLRVFSLLLLATASSAHSQEPAPKSGTPSTFFERLFGSGARPPRAIPTTAGTEVRQAPEETWELYRRGNLPPGEIQTLAQAAELTPGSFLGRTTYLTGQFFVTAAGQKRAILRSADVPGPVRVVVEYASGSVPPAEGSSVVFRPSGALLVRRLTKSADNGVTIYARDIRQP